MNSEILQAMVQAYCEGTPAQVKQLITIWEAKLNLKVDLEPPAKD